MKVKLLTSLVVAFLTAACASLQKVASLSDVIDLNTLTQPPAAISTSFADADKTSTLGDDLVKSIPQALAVLPRTAQGDYKLAPGFYEITCKSYCLHAGTHAPSGGDAYLPAPLKGPRKEIIQSLLRNSARHPTLKQQEVQLLIWAVLAHTNFKQLSPNLQLVAAQLLSPKELFDLNGGVMGILPEAALTRLKQGLPPAVQQVLDTENKLRMLFSKGASSYEEFQRIAILTGAAPVDNPQYKRGRWCRQPNGYFIRFFPSGYTRTKVQVYVPKAPNGSKQALQRGLTAGLLPGWLTLDLTAIVAVPANTTAQRLGLEGSGYAGGGGTTGGGGSSDSYGEPTPPTKDKKAEESPKLKGKQPSKEKPEKPTKKGVDDKDEDPPTKKDPTKDGKSDPKKPTKEPQPNAGNVDDDYVRSKLPECFKSALKKFGKSEDSLVAYFKRYHNKRCSGRFFDDIDDFLKSRNPSQLTDCDAYALWGYTTNLFYRDLNKWLREGSHQDQTKEIQRSLEKGLNKLPVYPEKYVYRGLEIKEEELQQFLAEYRAGSVHTWEGFISCGGTKDGSFAGRERVNIIFEIEHKTGKDISELADGIRCGNPPMAPPEILIKPNSIVQSTRDPVFDGTNKKWVLRVKQIK